MNELAETMGPETAPTKILWTEEEAAVLMNCSPQTMALRRKRGEIDHTTNPSGRPMYMMHHLVDYLMKHEKQTGRRMVTMADVPPFYGTLAGRVNA